MKRTRKIIESKFMESSILGLSGLVAITLAGFAVYILGMIFSLKYFSTPFVDGLLMLIKFPFFFIITAIIKIVIGGKLIELLVKYISKMLGIKRIIIAPDKPITIVVKKK